MGCLGHANHGIKALGKFRIIVLTADTDLPGEAGVIRQLFGEGMDTLHLRKTSCTPDQLRAYLDRIPAEYYSRIVLHSHFGLLEEYPLKGVHLNSRSPEYTGPKPVHKSKSLHTLQDLLESPRYDYVFISPVFESISKPGHMPSIGNTELADTICTVKAGKGSPVIGLGGVNESNAGILKNMGFDGAALLGYLWADAGQEKTVERFKKIREAVEQ